MSANMTAQQFAMLHEIELIDDAFCDIIQDQYAYLTPEVERTLTRAIERLRAWREQYGMTYPPP